MRAKKRGVKIDGGRVRCARLTNAKYMFHQIASNARYTGAFEGLLNDPDTGKKLHLGTFADTRRDL